MHVRQAIYQLCYIPSFLPCHDPLLKFNLTFLQVLQIENRASDIQDQEPTNELYTHSNERHVYWKLKNALKEIWRHKYFPFHFHEVEEVILRGLYCSQTSTDFTDSMQSLSNSIWYFPRHSHISDKIHTESQMTKTVQKNLNIVDGSFCPTAV